MLRSPAWPGSGSTNWVCATDCVLNALTVPGSDGLWNTPVFTLPVRYALPLRSQSVGHCAPLKTLNGNALVSRMSPDHCHPPMTASSPLLMFAANRWFRPNGRSATKSAVNWWVASKSEGARNWYGFQALMICPPRPAIVPTRSASDDKSIDLENV